MYFRSALAWLVLAAVAVLNGTLRNAYITPAIGESGGHIVSTVLLCLFIFIISLALIRRLGPESGPDAVRIGLLWVVMTLAFEFLAGHYLFGHPWERLFADYNVARGRVWVLVLIVTVLAPAISMRIRKPV